MVGNNPAPISGSGKQLATGNQFQKEKQDQDQGSRVIQSLLEDGGRGDSLDPLPGAGGFIYFGIVFSIFQPAAFVKDFKSICQPFAKVFVNIFQLYFLLLTKIFIHSKPFPDHQCWCSSKPLPVPNGD